MIQGSYIRLDIWPLGRVERRKTPVKVGTQVERSHVVTIRKTSRDPKTDKVVYETVESIDVYEATDSEVKEAVLRGLNTAAKK